MTDEELLKLSAYFDGEAAEAECRELNAALPSDSARRAMLAAFAALGDAAVAAAVPQPFGDGESVSRGARCWSSILNDISALQARTEVLSEPQHRAAAVEEVPSIAPDRFERVWHGVSERLSVSATNESGLSSEVSREAVPRVISRRWKGVWNEISQRTSRVANRTVPAKPSPFSTWIWAAGIGLAASILLAISFPSPVQDQLSPSEAIWRDKRDQQEKQDGLDGPHSNGTPTVSMNVPEVQGDDYGVRVRFLPGSVDPVISLYYKTPNRGKASSSSASDEQ